MSSYGKPIYYKKTLFEFPLVQPHIPKTEANKKQVDQIFRTSGFWPRVRARALRAPVFLSSLTHKTGRCAPPPPIAASLILIHFHQNYKLTNFQDQNASL
jgi:hypothetical protein